MADQNQKDKAGQTAGKGKGKGKNKGEVLPPPVVTEGGQVVPQKIQDKEDKENKPGGTNAKDQERG